MESSTSGSIKRTRTPSSGCLVDGCNSDLSECRDYHRRHKVCELHSKTPKVTIKGREQRFCQQCSRFHSLEEFDEGKRSCRKRLDWHNRRRRKPQPEPMAINSARFLSSYQGARLSAFDHPQILATGPVVSSGEAGCMKSENDFVLFNGQSQFDLDGRNVSIPESLCDKGERQFSFLQGVNSTINGGISSSGRSQKSLFDGLKLNRGIDSECALSLLSSTPAETGEFGWRHMMLPNGNPPSRPFISSLQLDGLEMERESTPLLVTQGLGSTIVTNANLHFHIGPHASSSRASHPHHKLFSSKWE